MCSRWSQESKDRQRELSSVMRRNGSHLPTQNVSIGRSPCIFDSSMSLYVVAAPYVHTYLGPASKIQTVSRNALHHTHNHRTFPIRGATMVGVVMCCIIDRCSRQLVSPSCDAKDATSYQSKTVFSVSLTDLVSPKCECVLQRIQLDRAPPAWC